MKLLIIAGPYEADRIRRAAVSAQFETVAVEPGESLSGWISASRPDIIVMAPQMVSPDPAVALAKVRSVPRGRVPIFLVGDAADEGRFRGLADGFFVRPVAPNDLIEQARARVGRQAEGDAGAGADADAVRADAPAAAREKSGPHAPPGAVDATGAAELARPAPTPPPKSAPHAVSATYRGLGSLKPLVAEGDAPSGPGPSAAAARPRPPRPADLLQQLADSIDDSLDAEIRDAARGLTAGEPAAPEPDGPHAPQAAAADDNEALEELKDESSQKTREVPSHVVAKMASSEANRGAGSEANRGTPGDAASDSHRKKTRKQKALDATVVGIAAVGEAAAAMLRRPAPSERGAIGAPDLAALLGRIHRDRLTGRLALRRGEAEKVILFEDGAPIVARSNVADDRMGEMLVREGLLSPEQRAQGGQILADSGRRLGAVLVEMGVLKAGELAALVRRHNHEIIFSLFAWQDGEGGEWSLAPDLPEKDEPIRIVEPPPALILEGIRRKYTAARLLRCLGGGAAVLRPAGSGAALRIVDQMSPTDEERALAPLFDGLRTLDAIHALVRAADVTLYGLAWALVAVGGLEDVDAWQRGAEPPASPDPPAGPSDADRERDRAIDRARVLARYALVCDGDYFQILGLSRDASPHEVLRAHQALARELSPDTLDAALVEEMAAELRAIRAVVDEGARVLADARLRHLYQQHLPSFAASVSASAPARRPE